MLSTGQVYAIAREGVHLFGTLRRRREPLVEFVALACPTQPDPLRRTGSCPALLIQVLFFFLPHQSYSLILQRHQLKTSRPHRTITPTKAALAKAIKTTHSFPWVKTIVGLLDFRCVFSIHATIALTRRPRIRFRE